MALLCRVRTRSYTTHGSIKVSIFFLSLVLLQPPKSGGSVVIGSKPPVCVNKCMKCKPCMATLVVPDQQRKNNNNNIKKKKGFKLWSRGEDNDNDNDDSYYLLSWKCRCGHNLFQP